MAHVWHYVMNHTANFLYYADAIKPTKKQYGLKAGLHAFADQGSAAVVRKLTQFHTIQCFQPRAPSTLTREDCCNALTSLMFLTKKNHARLRHVHAPMEVPNNLTLPKRKQLHGR